MPRDGWEVVVAFSGYLSKAGFLQQWPREGLGNELFGGGIEQEAQQFPGIVARLRFIL